jgi:hypothetical protein
MDPRKLSFLQAVIGTDGANALTKATSRQPRSGVGDPARASS